MATIEKEEIGEIELAKDWLEGLSSQTITEVITDLYNGTGMCTYSAKQAWMIIGIREGWLHE